MCPDDEEEFWEPARIEQQNDGTWAIVNDDTEEVVVTGFRSREDAEQSALGHDFCIVGQEEDRK